MLKSWLLLLASDKGSGTPSSGTPAQEAVWGETTALRPALPKVQEDDDRAMKERGFRVQKKRVPPETGKWACGNEKNDVFCLDQTASTSSVAWRAERGEQCLI